MNPEVAEAVPRLVRDGVLTAEQAAITLRVARGELLSIRDELRLLLYGGVLLVAGGVGLLVQQNLEHIGPLTIAIGLGLAAALCLAWVMRTALPFSWGEQSSPHLAFDYVLLLGALLAAADLAYVELRFTALGANWPWHLLLISLFYGLLALRYDSRVLLSLALTTFAAWRGVALGLAGPRLVWDPARSSSIRANTIACGALFVVLGWALVGLKKKAHFDEVATHLGWLLVLGGLASSHAALLLGVAAPLAFWAFRAGRFALFGMGVLASYFALTRFVFSNLDSEELLALYFAVSGLALVLALHRAHRAMQEER